MDMSTSWNRIKVSFTDLASEVYFGLNKLVVQILWQGCEANVHAQFTEFSVREPIVFSIKIFFEINVSLTRLNCYW